MKIEIVGPGCPRCHETERRVRSVITKHGLNAEIVHITDLKEIAKRKVMFTPAVIVDGEIKFSGKIPTEEEIAKALGIAS